MSRLPLPIASLLTCKPEHAAPALLAACRGLAASSEAPARSTSGREDQAPAPVRIRVNTKHKRLELSYADGTTRSFSAELLRVCSPSADTQRGSVAQGAAGRGKVVAGRRHVGIMTVEAVGNYAIRIQFDDLHSAGIFTWTYLAMLAGPGRWRLLRAYLTALKAAGQSRDPQLLQQRRIGSQPGPAPRVGGSGDEAGAAKGAGANAGQRR